MFTGVLSRQARKEPHKIVLGLVAATGLLGGLLFSQREAHAAVGVRTTTLEYMGDEKEAFEGLLSVPKGTIKGGVLVVHNWMGVTDETKKQAERFAELGYLVVSADIYGKGQRPKDAKQAGEFAGRFKSDRALFRSRLNLALETLRSRAELKEKPLFAAGYCFGGTGVIELARSGADVKTVFSFHGGLDSPKPEDGASIKAKVIAFHGADDPYVEQKDLAAFEAEMATHKVDWRLIKFGGAVHSFTNQGAGDDVSKGAAYDAKADARSWAMSTIILAE